MKTSKLLIIIILLIITFQIVTRLIHSSIDYDEGFNLQVSLNLRQSLQYATFDNIFDHRITTGPTVLMPAALFINSTFPLLPRLIPSIYSLLFITFILTKIQHSNSEKISFLTLIFFTPLFFFFSTKILGELPGFLFLSFSYWFFSKKRWLLTGIFLGLSFLTKSLFVIGFLPIFILLINNIKNLHIASFIQTLKTIILIVSGFLIVYTVWNLYMLLALGLNFESFRDIFSHYFLEAQKLSLPQPKLLNKRLEMLSYVFSFNAIVFSLLTGIINIYILITQKNHFLKLISLYYLISLSYFLFRGSTSLYRHIFPAILSLAIIIPCFINIYFEKVKTSGKKMQLIYITIPLVILFLFMINPTPQIQGRISQLKFSDQSLIFLEESYFPFLSPTPLLISQYKTAEFISQNIPPQEKITGYEWWNAPEISYLSDRKIYRDVSDPANKYIIYQIYGLLSPGLYQTLDKEIPKQEIYKSYGYNIFKKGKI